MVTIVFDLDGTLADTSADLIAAANRALGALGLRPVLDPVADAAIAFRGGRAMLHAALGRLPEARDRRAEEIVEAGYPLLLASYGERLDAETRLYPHVEATLTTLARLGYRLAVCTNKPEALAARLLERLGIAGRFAALVGADTLPVRKPDPLPLREAVRRAGGAGRAFTLVGDSETDLATARAAGVPAVMVGFGPEGMAVARHRPEALIGDFRELPATLRAIGLQPPRPPHAD